MKVGILYICTGKYSIFWDSFYKSAEQFFLTDSEKHYFVFTDVVEIPEDKNITIIKAAPKGFPLDSLLRFEMFLSIKEQLEQMDYLFFLNSNMKFVATVTHEVIPSDLNSGLMATFHPGYYNKEKFTLPYERSKKSKAYINYKSDTAYFYYMGGFNGGKTKDYLKLTKVCHDNVQTDIRNGAMAIYHDESHLNHYLSGKSILQLSPAYGFPEGATLPFEPKIVILNKMKHGGKYFDKLPQKSYGLRIYLKIKRMYAAFIWRYQ